LEPKKLSELGRAKGEQGRELSLSSTGASAKDGSSGGDDGAMAAINIDVLPLFCHPENGHEVPHW